MSKQKLVGIALLVGGVVALYFGYQAHESFGSQVTEFFEGTPSDKALALLIGGGVATLVGLGMLGLGFKKKAK